MSNNLVKTISITAASLALAAGSLTTAYAVTTSLLGSPNSQPQTIQAPQQQGLPQGLSNTTQNNQQNQQLQQQLGQQQSQMPSFGNMSNSTQHG